MAMTSPAHSIADAETSALQVSLDGRLGSFALDVAFSVPMRGVTALVGPSGCGKTTILRCIAGLERLAGHISVGGEVWQDTATGVFRPPHRRRVGYVFQEASLFPHLSVADNLRYAMHRNARSHRTRSDRAGRDRSARHVVDVEAIAALLGLGALLARSPAALSGGERQRVAVGRALLTDPDVLLMDEPLSALDAHSKADILPYFETLHAQLALPIIYISHDFSEVERLADHLVLLRDGRVTATGRLVDMQTDDRLPLLSAPSASVVLVGTVAAIDEQFHLTAIALDGGVMTCLGRHGAIGDRRRLRIAASDVSLALSPAVDSTIVNCLPARVVSIDRPAGGPLANVVIALGTDGRGSRIAARITMKSAAALGIVTGSSVYAQIKGAAVVAGG